MSTKELTLENLQTESPKFKNAQHFPGTHNGQRLRKIGHKNFDNYFPFQHSTIGFDKLWDFKEIRNLDLYKAKKNAFAEFSSKTQYWSGRGAISSNVPRIGDVAAKRNEYFPLR